MRFAVGQTQSDTRLGGEQVVMLVYVHDVFKPCNRPDPAILIIFVQMNGVFIPQACEVGPMGVLLKQGRVDDVNRFERQAVGVWDFGSISGVSDDESSFKGCAMIESNPILRRDKLWTEVRSKARDKTACQTSYTTLDKKGSKKAQKKGPASQSFF
jgi:hypothetical protein